MTDILGRGGSQRYECIVFRERQSDQARQKIRKGEGSEFIIIKFFILEFPKGIKKKQSEI